MNRDPLLWGRHLVLVNNTKIQATGGYSNSVFPALLLLMLLLLVLLYTFNTITLWNNFPKSISFVHNLYDWICFNIKFSSSVLKIITLNTAIPSSVARYTDPLVLFYENCNAESIVMETSKSKV